RFGVNGIRVLPQFEVLPHDQVKKCIAAISKPIFRTGMDFGFEESYNAVVRLAVDPEKKYLYIYWEYYQNKMTDDRTAEELRE
ncbi:PBSX family phage terminase large subunit, partial [Bacillus thuringiensis]|nr:PBSX family phage terminase large subunit [Bacillus thuringiensis]